MWILVGHRKHSDVGSSAGHRNEKWATALEVVSSSLMLRRYRPPAFTQLLGGLQGLLTIEVLGGSWDLVSRVINRVTVVIITYNPN